jgi:ABC-type nickel/cobalt efflux system permease component RcnA
VASSLVIVSLLGIALDRSGLDVMAKGTWLEAMSYGLVVVIGLGMTVSALLGHTHTHRPLFGAVERGTGPGLVLAAGLTPCASATILLLFALANGLFVLGMVAALVMAVGMGVTVTLVGLVAILGRRALLVPTRHRPRAGAWLRRALTVTGAMALTLIGSLLFAGAWTRLP